MPFPDDYPAEEVAGKTAEFDVKVKEVREKELPELDDDFAAEASEFDTLDGAARAHLRSDPRDPRPADRRALPQAALDAAVAKAKVELPDPVVEARAAEMWRRVERSLQRQGMDPENYLQIQGKTREEMVKEARPDAEQALQREAVLEAVAEAEGIEITEEDMLEALQIPPGHEDHGHPEPQDALRDIRESGREELLKEDLRMRRALELIAEAGEADPAGAGPGPRGDLDAGEGTRGEGRPLDARLRLGEQDPRQRMPSGTCVREDPGPPVRRREWSAAPGR